MEIEQQPFPFHEQVARVFADLVNCRDRSSITYAPPLYSRHEDRDDPFFYQDLLFRPEMQGYGDDEEETRVLVVTKVLASFRSLQHHHHHHHHGKCMLAMIIIHLPAEDDHVLLISRILDLDPDLVRGGTESKHLLHLAIYAQNLPLMDLLIQRGFDIDAKVQLGLPEFQFVYSQTAVSPLEFAIYCPSHTSRRTPCFLDGVKLLVQQGADTTGAIEYLVERKFNTFFVGHVSYYADHEAEIEQTIHDCTPCNSYPFLK